MIMRRATFHLPMNWNDYGANMNDDTSKARKTKKPLSGYEILLCLTGGIACYKSADLTSKLGQARCLLCYDRLSLSVHSPAELPGLNAAAGVH